MNDLGMHTVHLPLRLGLGAEPRLRAAAEKSTPRGLMARAAWRRADTWTTPCCHTDVPIGGHDVPMRLEMKRLAPGEMNTWFLEVLGHRGRRALSTKEANTLWTFERSAQPQEQVWKRADLGHQMPFATVTGSIFEAGCLRLLPADAGRLVAERAEFWVIAGLRHARRGGAQPRNLGRPRLSRSSRSGGRGVGEGTPGTGGQEGAST
jgi:hypothetical protein